MRKPSASRYVAKRGSLSMKLLAISISALFAGVNSAAALSYCAPDDQPCRQSSDFPFLVFLGVLVVMALVSKAITYFRQRQRRK